MPQFSCTFATGIEIRKSHLVIVLVTKYSVFLLNDPTPLRTGTGSASIFPDAIPHDVVGEVHVIERLAGIFRAEFLQHGRP